jgi:hypothetical protein
MRQGLDEGFSDGIEAPIIVANAPGTVWFASEDDGSGMTRSGRLYPAAVQQVEELPAELREFALGQAFGWASPRHGAVACLKDQLDAPVGRQAWRWTTQDICEFRLESRKGGVICAL